MMKGNFLSSNSFDIYSRDQSELLKNMTNSLATTNKSIIGYNDVINKVEIEILASKTFQDVCQNEFKLLKQKIQAAKNDNESRMIKFIADLHSEFDNMNHQDKDQMKNGPINDDISQELTGFSQFIKDPRENDQNRTMYLVNSLMIFKAI